MEVCLSLGLGTNSKRLLVESEGITKRFDNS